MMVCGGRRRELTSKLAGCYRRSAVAVDQRNQSRVRLLFLVADADAVAGHGYVHLRDQRNIAR